MTTGQTIGAIVMVLIGLWITIGEWRSWIALGRPISRVRNKAILSTLAMLLMVAGFLYVGFF